MFRLLIFLFFFQSLHAQQFISRKDAIEDMDSMIAVIKEVHYNPFLYISENEFLKSYSFIRQSLGDSIEFNEFLFKIYQLTSVFNDSHTAPAFVQPALRSFLGQPIFLPLSFLADNENKVYIVGDNSYGIKASQAISINGINLSELFSNALVLWGGLPAFSKEMAERFFAYLLFLKGARPPFMLEVENSGKKEKIEIEKGLSFSQALALTLPQISKGAYNFKLVGNKIGWIEFNSMSGDWKTFDRFLDSSMNVLRDNNIGVLAVDLRNNSGGNSLLGELLLCYITGKNFSLMGKRYWKISRQYKEYLINSGHESDYLNKKNGSIWEIGNCKIENQKFNVKDKFNGRVYFITGPFTFSSANMIADGVKHYKLATLIGEPTGETTNDFGEVYSFMLPKSKIQVNTTTSFDVGTDCRTDKIQPVQPDILIKHKTEQKLKDTDPVLEYLLKNY